jgi:tetratricopeptide (TPR) repeat protein
MKTSLEPGVARRPAAASWLLLATLALALSVMAVWALLWAWASALTVVPTKAVEQWLNNPSSYQSNDKSGNALRFTRRLDASLKFNPFSANTYLTKAQLLLLIQDFGSAQAILWEGIDRQPTWDYLWAVLAQTASAQQQTDTAVAALARAMELGPYEADTQGILIPLIFKYWQRIEPDPSLRDDALSIIGHTLRHKPHGNLTLDSARQHHLLGVLVPLDMQDSQKMRVSQWMQTDAKSQ